MVVLQALVLVEAAQEAQEALEQGGVKVIAPKEDEEATDLQVAARAQGTFWLAAILATEIAMSVFLLRVSAVMLVSLLCVV